MINKYEAMQVALADVESAEELYREAVARVNALAKSLSLYPDGTAVVQVAKQERKKRKCTGWSTQAKQRASARRLWKKRNTHGNMIAVAKMQVARTDISQASREKYEGILKKASPDGSLFQ
jgi:hypothetical protein